MDCYECMGYGDDYYWDEEANDFVSACPGCPNYEDFDEEDYDD